MNFWIMKRNISLMVIMLISTVCSRSVLAQGLPMVSEGLRWVYAEHHVNVWIAEEYGLPSINEGRLYRYEMRGDTVIDSKTYKKCYCISMSRQPLWDTVGVHCSNEVPAACLRQDGYEVYCRFPDKPVRPPALIPPSTDTDALFMSAIGVTTTTLRA